MRVNRGVHQYAIPVPAEVTTRQELIREARDQVRAVYGTTGPYRMEDAEYDYFVHILLTLSNR